LPPDSRPFITLAKTLGSTNGPFFVDLPISDAPIPSTVVDSSTGRKLNYFKSEASAPLRIHRSITSTSAAHTAPTAAGGQSRNSTAYADDVSIHPWPTYRLGSRGVAHPSYGLHHHRGGDRVGSSLCRERRGESPSIDCGPPCQSKWHRDPYC
jgi:hypothetical protein